MAIRTELSLKIQNSPGALSLIFRQLSEERINILALNLEAGGTLRFLVDNPLHAAALLEEQEHSVEKREVLMIQVPNNPGAFEKASELLANAGVNVEYAYVSVVEDHAMASIVAGVEDPQRAAMAAGV
jgi:hypothetical protein